MTSPPKHHQHHHHQLQSSSSCDPAALQQQQQQNKLVNRLGLASLSLTGGPHRTRWRLMVLGHQSVGKSAFVVRFLTRRFIGDYDPKCERSYSVNTVLNGDQITLELLDGGGRHLEDGSQSELEAKIRWADAFVLLFSVTDKCSFDECCRLRFLIGYNKRRRKHLFGTSFGHGPIDYGPNSGVSVALVANKIDQVEDRMVTREEGEKRSRDLGCDLFYEVSVREEADVAKRVVESLYAQWKQLHQGGHQLHPSSSHHHHHLNLFQPFGRKCLESFANRCGHSSTSSGSRSSSTSMDVINELEDGSILPVSLSLESPTLDRNSTPPENFRSRASTEGSLSYQKKKRIAGKINLQVTADHQQQSDLEHLAEHGGLGPGIVSGKPPCRRMSISLRGREMDIQT